MYRESVNIIRCKNKTIRDVHTEHIPQDVPSYAGGVNGYFPTIF